MIWKTQNYIPFFPTESQFSIKVSNRIFSKKKKYLMRSFQQTPKKQLSINNCFLYDSQQNHHIYFLGNRQHIYRIIQQNLCGQDKTAHDFFSIILVFKPLMMENIIPNVDRIF